MKKVEDFILPAAILVNRYSGEYPDNAYLASDVLKVAEALQAEYAKRADFKPFRRPHIGLIQEGKYGALVDGDWARIRVLEGDSEYPIEATVRVILTVGMDTCVYHFNYQGACLESPKIRLMVKNLAYE